LTSSVFNLGNATVPDLIATARVQAIADRIDRDLNTTICGSQCALYLEPDRQALAQSVNFTIMHSNAIIGDSYIDGQIELAILAFPGPPATPITRPNLEPTDTYFQGISRWALEGHWAFVDAQPQRHGLITAYRDPIRDSAAKLKDSRWWWHYVSGLNLLKVLAECRALGEQSATQNITTGLMCGVNGALAAIEAFAITASAGTAYSRLTTSLRATGRISNAEYRLILSSKLTNSGAGPGVRVATGTGGLHGEMSVVRTITKGEKITGIVDEVAGLSYATGNEFAVVRLTDGTRAIVTGGPGGITFAEGRVTRIFAHTHPFPASGIPSPDDILMLTQLRQKSSWIISRDGTVKFGAGG
jgi:hypothetical protein